MGKYKLNTNKRWFKWQYLDSKKLLKSLIRNLKNLLKNLQNSRAYHWLDPHNYQGLERTLHSIGLLVMAGLLLFSAISPLVDIYITHKYYSLNSQTSGLVGNVSKSLANQITYDSQQQAYVFNADGKSQMSKTIGPDKVPLSLLKAKVGGGNDNSRSLYAVQMPTDPKQGISYYDTNTGLSFQMVPDFTQMSAKQIDNHIVYPINKDMQMVYSVKNNGLKEDIVLKKFVSDSLIYRYSLKLPQTLEARMLTDGSGSLGIYSADPALFTHSTYGSDYDPAKIESAQLHARKDHLVFAIPAPVIQGTGDRGQGTATAEFGLSNDGSTLTVSADHLKGLHYPVSIDPTVVITSTSDFAIGNNEDNNITYPANQINRGSVTGGSISNSGGWTATTALPVATNAASSVTYNGYVYEIGGFTTTNVTTVSYASIAANGTIGAWTATTSLPVANSYFGSVAYNGYLYEIGGFTSAVTAAVNYASINANGTIGAWTATTSLPVANSYGTYIVYNGYLYEIGGNTPSTVNTVNYASINANGTIGAWTATTSLPAATYAATSVAYNGYLYEIGGVNPSVTASVYYAPINANGTIGSWTATTSLPTATYGATSVVYNGYVYEIAGYTTGVTTTVSYSPINANGTLGAWTATTVLPTATYYATSVAYNGYIYEIGGNTPTTVATVSYAKIDPAGTTTAYTATTVLPAATSGATSIVYNGYVYEIGGYTTTFVATVYYAPLNANGTIGAWTATTALPVTADYATSVAYNGYLYEIGGTNGSAVATVYYAPLNANGTIGAWTATTALPTATYFATSVVYNGYLYEIGGYAPATTTVNVYYAPINANGTIGAWTATTALPTATAKATSVIYNGYLYEIGGNNGSVDIATVYYAPLNANGTIGAWTTTTSLPAATGMASSVVYNGYLYEIGGWNVATVYYAPLNANGTVGSWTANTALPTATAGATSVVYNGYIYEIGGGNPSSTATVDYAFINNGGPGTAGAWTATTPLPVATGFATSVAYNGYLYEISGNASGYTTTVSYASIATNGTIGAWNATSILPTAVVYATSVAYNGYLYEIGGFNGSNATNFIYYAPINANGTIGAWIATTSLPTATYAATSVAYNGYLYEIGGDDDSSQFTTVSYAPINANGTIGAWTATTPLPIATGGATSVVYNGYLYEIGGFTTSNVATVSYAPINANGTLGAWTATTSLPAATDWATSVAYNGYLYEIGGVNPSVTSTVDYAPINANGTIGVWTATTALPAATDHATSVVYNGYIYEIGGLTLSYAYVTTVSYAPLNVMPRVGHYSQMFNFGSQITPVSISYNGNLPNANGLSSIQYKIAGSNAVLGSSQYSSVLTGTSAACNTIGAVQYVFASITLDDSGSAAFPDVSTTPANVSDFTVTYTTVHPPPNLRMRNGTYFSNGIIQPMDTCALVPIPNQPTIGTATDSGVGRAYNNGSAVVSFTPSAGGYAATSYTVTSSTGGFSATGTSSPLTVTGLQSGVAYTFTVTASNAIGSSYTSSASNSITATTVPQPVTIGTATNTGSGRPYNNGLATVGFTPGGTGGLAATYVATASAGGYTGSGGSSPVTVAGLQSGGSYTFTVVASNANGSAVASSASNSITATTIPQAPTIGTATNSGSGRPYNNGLATVGYTANGTGGTTVTYTATASPGGYSASGGSPISVTGLQSATNYSFTVTATNANGSATSGSSNTITATTVPQAPTIGSAADVGSGRPYNNGLATVAFTDNATGGSAITGHTATASAGGYNGSGASPISVAGQQSGVGYAYTVTATNANGTSAASSASGSVTATTVPQAPTIGTATTTGNHTASVGYTPNGTGGLGVTYTTAGGGSGSGGSPIAVSGLNAATAYSFTVTASNSNGSATSGGSNTITTTGAIVSGGNLTSDATYYYRTFFGSGTFGVTGSLTCDVLLIGSGGGGTYYSTMLGNGGSAGAINYQPSQSISSSQSVGVNGGGSTGWPAHDGYASTFGALTAAGGLAAQGASGGPSQGGAGAGGAGGSYYAGPGVNTYSAWASATGTGVSGYYAGGGGAAAYSPQGDGGSGGGGHGAYSGTTATAGVSNTGSGGGAGGSSYPGGNGGSGIVIVRYLISAV